MVYTVPSTIFSPHFISSGTAILSRECKKSHTICFRIPATKYMETITGLRIQIIEIDNTRNIRSSIFNKNIIFCSCLNGQIP